MSFTLVINTREVRSLKLIDFLSEDPPKKVGIGILNMIRHYKTFYEFHVALHMYAH